MTNPGAGEGHLTDTELARMAADPEALGEAPKTHLLGGCIRCTGGLRRQMTVGYRDAVRLTARAILIEEDPRTDLLELVAARVRSWALLMEAEERNAPALAEELLHLPAPRRLEAARQSRRYRSLELSRHLSRQAREEVFRDPAHAAELARLAVEVADRLESGGYPPGIACDVLALAWAALGNAYRVGSDLFEAERALRTARAFLDEGSGHPVVRAEVWSLLGSLRMDQTRYAEAETVLRQAAEIYERHGSRLQAGRTLMKLGKLMGEAGETDRALGLLRRARETLGEDEPRLRLLTGHTLVVTLNDAERVEEAWELFGNLRTEYERSGGDFWMDQRRMWIEARLLQASGEPDRAEEAFREVRRGFAEREAAYDFAVVSLELAALLLTRERTGEVRKLAEELLPIFTSRQVHRHALAGLALFQNAATAERATTELVQELLRYLQRARNNPYLPFPAPAR